MADHQRIYPTTTDIEKNEYANEKPSAPISMHIHDLRGFADENNATTESDIEETFKRLVNQLGKSPAEVFDALKNQTVDLVLTAHPTQSVCRSLLQKHARIRNCLSRLYGKDITPDEKQELDEAFLREIQTAFHTDEIWRTPPTPQDEMRAGMSYLHETIWKGVPKFFMPY
jgi:phosphoenolpyruvate carboxylase